MKRVFIECCDESERLVLRAAEANNCSAVILTDGNGYFLGYKQPKTIMIEGENAVALWNVMVHEIANTPNSIAYRLHAYVLPENEIQVVPCKITEHRLKRSVGDSVSKDFYCVRAEEFGVTALCDVIHNGEDSLKYAHWLLAAKWNHCATRDCKIFEARIPLDFDTTGAEED